MKETYRTLVFGGIAVVSVTLAAVTAHYSRPKPIEDFALVGEPFFPEFNEPSEARSLEVVVIDEKTKKTRKFRVEYSDGLWRIPTHHGYPAEAKERLASTAASVMGIVRESLAGRRTAQHARFGVLDPTAEGIDDAEGVGERVTLRKADGTVLADFIIGKRADADDNASQRRQSPDEKTDPVYFVRRPDEDETYRARLEIDLSTEFAKWIEPDLLRIEPNAEIKELVVKKHAFKKVERQEGPFLEISMERDPPNDQISQLTRENSTWNLDGLNAKTEEVNSTNVNAIVAVLRDLKIAGVRPKPNYDGKPLITPDFRINVPQTGATQGLVTAIRALQSDLRDKGFRLVPSKTDRTRAEMYATTGQVTATTSEGIVYHLYFGEAVTGDADEIEIGGTKSESKKASAKDPQSPKKDGDTDKDDSQTAAKNRYLYLRVEFDEKFLSNKPTPPTEPRKPEPFPIPAVRPNATPGFPPTTTNDEGGEGQDRSRYAAALDQYETDKSGYQSALVRFQNDLKTHAKDAEKKKRKVQELNDRFADWYYVISSDSFKDLHLKRGELVTKKDPPKNVKQPKSQSNVPAEAAKPK